MQIDRPVFIPPKSIRATALAVIRNRKSQLLMMEGLDHEKNQFFYRPLGGGIEFREKATDAICREIKEEINKDIKVLKQLFIYENIFELEGQQAHEINFVFECEFVNPTDYDFKELPIIEDGRAVNRAVWRSLEEAKTEQRPIYPQVLNEYLAEV